MKAIDRIRRCQRGVSSLGLILMMACLSLAGIFWLKATSLEAGTSQPAEVSAEQVGSNSGPGIYTKNIEDIKAGELVWAYDPLHDKWVVEPVIKPLVHNYVGDMVSITVGDQTITSTGNHPYWVAGGAGLFDRQQARDVYPTDRASAIASGKGRWIAARDLEAGDMLVLRNGSRCPIDEVQVSYARQKVYNLKVADLHTYAVSELGVAVHNKPCFPPGTLILMGDGSVKPIEDIRLGDQVMAGDPLSRGPPQPAEVTGLVRDFTACLVDVRFTAASGATATITPTRYHPFWTNNRGWIEAKDLKPRDVLQDSGRNAFSIFQVAIRPHFGRSFNFEVGGIHTYYALADDQTPVLVHNQALPALPYTPPAGLLGNAPPTFYHYGYMSQWNSGSFNNGLWPGTSLTTLGDLTSGEAYDGLGLGNHPLPPDAVFPVTPDNPVTYYGPADPAGSTKGGLPEYRAPQGTGPGTVGPPKPLS